MELNAKVLDMEYNGAVFEGMKLAGTVMIVSGFLLVLLPSNWTDYIVRLLTLDFKTTYTRLIVVFNLFFFL